MSIEKTFPEINYKIQLTDEQINNMVRWAGQCKFFLTMLNDNIFKNRNKLLKREIQKINVFIHYLNDQRKPKFN